MTLAVIWNKAQAANMTGGQGHDSSGWNDRLVPIESLQKRSSVTALQGGQESS